MPLALPTTGDDQVAQFQSEWQAAYDGASQEHLEGAKCRLIWALVHAAASRRHLQRGLELAEAALETDVRTPDEDRELRYYAAVAMYNLGDYLRARRALADLLERHPDCRQAAALQEEVTDLVVRNGLLGLGLFGGLVGLGVGLLAATAKRR